MAKATFSSSVTYTPGGGGVITQSFNVATNYTAIVAGRLDFAAAGVPPASALSIPFGSVQSALGLVVQNLTDVDITINWSAAASPQYRLAPGGVAMHWAPKKSLGSPVTEVEVNIASAPTEAGSIEYIVLGE